VTWKNRKVFQATPKRFIKTAWPVRVGNNKKGGREFSQVHGLCIGFLSSGPLGKSQPSNICFAPWVRGDLFYGLAFFGRVRPGSSSPCPRPAGGRAPWWRAGVKFARRSPWPIFRRTNFRTPYCWTRASHRARALAADACWTLFPLSGI